ncbi:ABC transporter permease subunit, partial [Vibrio parahaemolyticus]
KGRAFGRVRQAMQMMSVVTMAVPCMVLGLGFIFYFYDVIYPLNVLLGTLAFLVFNTVVHYYTVGQMTALTALTKLPSDIEATAASVKLPQYKLFFKVTLPVCMPAVLDI